MFKYTKFLQDVQDCQSAQFRSLDWMSQRFKKSNSKSWSHDRFWSWNEVRFLSRSISGWTNTIWSKLAPPPPPQVTGWKLAEIIILDFVRSRWKNRRSFRKRFFPALSSASAAAAKIDFQRFKLRPKGEGTKPKEKSKNLWFMSCDFALTRLIRSFKSSTQNTTW